MWVKVNGKQSKCLLLHIKKQWYDMILSGEKKEEYRAFSTYYQRRFEGLGLYPIDNCEQYILFRNGYSSGSPQFVARCEIEIGEGKPEWGAKEGKMYYILKIKEILIPEEVITETV